MKKRRPPLSKEDADRTRHEHRQSKGEDLLVWIKQDESADPNAYCEKCHGIINGNNICPCGINYEPPHALE